MSRAVAFAPATVANVAVGFDVLGFAVAGMGDRIQVVRDADQPGVVLEACHGPDVLPLDSGRNTATVALAALHRELKPPFGFRVTVDKGIPLSSGLGGSAASAVGAVVAGEALLDARLSPEDLMRFALEGEAVAGGTAHPDNIAPCLYGGLTAVVPGTPPLVTKWPVPSIWRAVLIHPQVQVETRGARDLLSPTVSLAQHAQALGRMAGLLAGCREGDTEMVRRSLIDDIVEPQRAALIPAFAEVKAAAIQSGAMGCSISGSGPTVFAWADSDASARVIATAMGNRLSAAGMPHETLISPIGAPGAMLVS